MRSIAFAGGCFVPFCHRISWVHNKRDGVGYCLGMGLKGCGPSIERYCQLSAWIELPLLLVALGLDTFLVLLLSSLLLGCALVAHGGRADESLGFLLGSSLGGLVLQTLRCTRR